MGARLLLDGWSGDSVVKGTHLSFSMWAEGPILLCDAAVSSLICRDKWSK